MKVSKLTWKKRGGGGEKLWPENSTIRGDDELGRTQPDDRKD